LSSFHPDIITLPLTPDRITSLLHHDYDALDPFGATGVVVAMRRRAYAMRPYENSELSTAN
jgi:hypothetical protein